MVSTRSFVIASIIAALCVAIFVVYTNVPTVSVIDLELAPPAGSDVNEIITFWDQVLDELPPQEAYDIFVAHYRQDDENEWHGLMHTLSFLLYERLGSAAINICDEAFFYGCYHEVLGGVFQDEGLGSVPAMAEHCGDVLGCQHGIGHGLVMYYGYVEENLNDALEKCTLVQDPEVIDGCLGGVFMEFTMKTMESSQIDTTEPSVVRPELCQNVLEGTKHSCYFWLVQWVISEAEGATPEERFAVGGNFCRAQLEQYQESCFRGVGYVVNRSTSAPEGTVALCDTTAAGERYDRDSCLILTAADYVHYEKFDYSKIICDQVSSDRRAYCPTSFSDFNRN